MLLPHYSSYSSPAVIAFHFCSQSLLQAVLSVVCFCLPCWKKKKKKKDKSTCLPFLLRSIAHFSESQETIRSHDIYFQEGWLHQKWLAVLRAAAICSVDTGKLKRLQWEFSVGRLVYHFCSDWNSAVMDCCEIWCRQPRSPSGWFVGTLVAVLDFLCNTLVWDEITAKVLMLSWRMQTELTVTYRFEGLHSLL